MRFVVTGAFKVYNTATGIEWSLSRSRLEILTRQLDWHMDDHVDYATNYLFCADPSRNTSKRLAASRYAIPVRTYEEMYAMMAREITRINGSVMHPEAALLRIERYGYFAEPRINPADPIQVARDAQPAGRLRATPRFKEALAEGMRKAEEMKPVQLGALVIKRRMKI